MPTGRTDLPWWAAPSLAIQFLTRVPTPWLARLTPDQAREGLARATGWLPLVGSGIGLVTAIVFVGAGRFWPPLIAATLALMVEAWLTGAFHEDAVADFCDAFGGVRDAEETRRILKDSRIGSYGVVGLGLAMALRLFATAALPGAVAVAAIVGAATAARLWAVLLLALAPPASPNGGLAKDIGYLPRRTLLLAIMSSLPGLAAFAILRMGGMLLVVVVAAALLLPLLARLITRRIGGSTGDCLGFAAYVGQLVVLLAAV